VPVLKKLVLVVAAMMRTSSLAEAISDLRRFIAIPATFVETRFRSPSSRLCAMLRRRGASTSA